MATQKQIKANKENARKSTGPITATGKETSSRNAVSHGLTAKHHFIDGEDPAQYEQLRTSLLAQMQVATVMEKHLVDHIAMLMWRVKRIPAFEVHVISALAEPQEITPATGRGAQDKGLTPKQAFSPRLSIAQALEVAFSKNFFDKISRYEAGLMNQIRRAFSDLLDLIQMRRQQEIAAAVANRGQEQLPPPAPTANASVAMNNIRWD